MHQGSGVQHFHQRGGTIGTFIYGAMELGAEKNEHRAKLLSLPFDDILHDRIQKGGIALNSIGEFSFKNPQFLTDYIAYKFHYFQ